jgi:5-methyltetrahydropteroyltriglutamate--homocysteine methyltransferase
MRIQTTHAGSLPRPESLVPLLRARHRKEPIDEAAFSGAVRQAVGDCVKTQVDCGIDIVSDGEMAKISYVYYVQDRLKGLEAADEAAAKGVSLKRFQRYAMPLDDFPDYLAYRAKLTDGPASAKPPVCTGPLAYRDLGPVKTELAMLNDGGSAAGVKASFMTAASPGVIAMFSSETSHYATEDDYVFALAEAMRPEYEAICNAGVMLQLDCPDLTMTPHMRYAQPVEGDPLRLTARNIDAINHAIANIPGDRVRLHLCWGNFEGPHDRDTEVAKLIPLLRATKARALSFEAANPRHEHEWEDWKNAKLPDDMILIPGVVDSTNNYVEHPRLIAQRIRHFADWWGNERVIAGVDCGFGTFASSTPRVFSSIVWAKLRALSEGARLASEL